MPTANSILLLQGDAEARLLADADSVMRVVFPERELRLIRAWTTRPDWLGPDAEGPPGSLICAGLLPKVDVRELLKTPHRLVVFALLPSVLVPALRHRDGGVFLAHQALRASWSAEAAARLAAECTTVSSLLPRAAVAALEPVIERLHFQGSAVAVCTAFRRVREPLEYRITDGAPTLRTRVRELNLEIARLSQRTGCFVFDMDRPLAQEGGATLDADCFGGEGRAAELALEEFAALALDAQPDDFMPMEAS
jgi:hypothetical protein